MRSRALAALLAALTALAAAGCGDSDPPLRIGVIVDCVGINRSLRAAELSGAQLPLIERGAERRGPPARGLGSVEVAGRDVELVTGCTEWGEFSTLTTEARSLAELERVDAVVAGAGGADQVALREVARMYPRVAFVGVVHGPREATLRRRAPNLFRFGADEAQGVGGLGDYAYRELGWRRAAIALGNWDAGWQARDAFAAEFCARGGRLAGQVAPDFFDPAGGDLEAVPRDVDGVAVFAGAFFGPGEFLKRLAARTPDPARGILLGPGITGDPALLKSAGPGLAGVTGSAYDRPARVRAYLRRYSRAFPALSREVASTELVTGYHDAVESVLVALERADGDPARLQAELRAARPKLLSGRVRVDRNGQAVAAPTLVRVTRGVRLEEIGRLPLVDQSLGGLLPATLRPGSEPVECGSGRDDAPREARALGSGGEPAGT